MGYHLIGGPPGEIHKVEEKKMEKNCATSKRCGPRTPFLKHFTAERIKRDRKSRKRAREGW